MAKVIVEFKIMPENVNVDLETVKSTAVDKIKAFNADVLGDITVEPVAFGIKAVKIRFAYDENKGTTDDLEKEISNSDGIQSVEVLSVSRAMG
tara:strand:+ start:184 stop:462 length:279 start_codon:yes stop_codon:yes gene_type:complete